MRREVLTLQSRETGLLGTVERLRAERRLRETELEEVTARLEATERSISEREVAVSRISEQQRARRTWLSFRVRELYRRGREAEWTRRLLGDGSDGAAGEGIRYTALLADRDARLLEAYREDSRRLGEELSSLARERTRLAAVQGEAGTARERLEESERRQGEALARIRDDRAQHEVAIGELEQASRELGRIVSGIGGAGSAGGALDVRKFKGLLDWPAAGRVSRGFGASVHPKFKTTVPHPGWEIDAPAGADIRAVFDGEVAWAGPLHGYGLTAIVDHEGGILSVYTHASALLVERGQGVLRGEVLGKVGDSGSTRGPHLYFEIREGSKAVDPALWLRPGS